MLVPPLNPFTYTYIQLNVQKRIARHEHYVVKCSKVHCRNAAAKLWMEKSWTLRPFAKCISIQPLLFTRCAVLSNEYRNYRNRRSFIVVTFIFITTNLSRRTFLLLLISWTNFNLFTEWLPMNEGQFQGSQFYVFTEWLPMAMNEGNLSRVSPFFILVRRSSPLHVIHASSRRENCHCQRAQCVPALTSRNSFHGRLKKNGTAAWPRDPETRFCLLFWVCSAACRAGWNLAELV